MYIYGGTFRLVNLLRATNVHFTYPVNFTRIKTVFSIVQSKQDVAVVISGSSRTNKQTEAGQVLKGMGSDPD